MNFSSIDIFCHRVDNYGDLGVAYRFAKELKFARPACRVRAFFDDLAALREIADEIDPNEVIQERNSILYVKSWAIDREQAKTLGAADVTVEMFACDIPEPFMEMAYDNSKLIINLEYLSAEEWVEGYHLKESLLGRGTVRKFFFLPGFREATGGLIINSRLLREWESQENGGVGRFAFFNNLLDKYEVSGYGMIKQYKSGRNDISNQYESSRSNIINQYESSRDDIINQYESGGDDISNQYESSRNYISNQYELSRNDISNQYESGRKDISKQYKSGRDDISKQYESGRDDISKQYESGRNNIINQYESSSDDISKQYESGRNDVSNQYESGRNNVNTIPYNDILLGTVFTYERGFDTLLTDLAGFGRETLLLVFGVKSHRGMTATLGRLGVDVGGIVDTGKVRSYEPYPYQSVAYKNILIVYMKFVNQHTYDTLLCHADFNVVRGEDSLARAVLSGKPFVWNAYIQVDKYQHVKVEALLNTLRRYFDDEGVFAAYSDLMMKFNAAPSESPEQTTSERYDIFFKNLKKLELSSKRMYYFMLHNCDLVSKFCAFLDEY